MDAPHTSTSNRHTAKTGIGVVLALLAVAGAFIAGRYSGHAHADTEVAGVADHSHAEDTAAKSLWTCSMHPQVIQDHPGQCPICHMELTPVKGAANNGSDVIIDPAVLQNMGVRTAAVAKGPLMQSVRVVGYLEEPEPLHRDINLRVNGWIEKLYANTDGMVINNGQPLFDLYSPELTIAIDELIAAHRQVGNLAQDATAKSLFETSRRKLLQYGLTEAQIDGLAKLDTAPRTVPILAPIGGHLTVKMVYEGAAVKAGDLVMRIASRHQMWIDAQVYEQQMPLISDGQPVRATLVSQPGKTFEGKVLFVHPHVDPATRTAQVRMEISNEGLHLRQGMYASVEILADDYKEAIVVPREAVIDSGRRQIAFVDLGQGRFEPRDLTLGANGQDGAVQVLAGLKEGERVVTSGQFLIDSESRMREAIAKFGSSAVPENNDGKPAAVRAEASTRPAEPAAPPISAVASQVVVPHTDDLIKAYLALAKTLGARQSNTDPVNVSPLIDVSTMAAEHAAGEAKPLAAAVRDAAGAMRDKPIEAQRKAFIGLSDAVIALVRRSRPSPAVAAKLYLLNCPMAFDRGEGANWIQDTETVENPYYATSMKRCGSVIETLETSR